MNFRLTLHVLGGLVVTLGVTLLAPIPFSLYYRDGQWFSFLTAALVTMAVGGVLYRQFKCPDPITLREGFAIVTFTWLIFAVFGSLPYLLCAWQNQAGLPNVVDAFFESMSGFTTTGATVITDIEANPKSLLFWRALSQWMGGMGIIVLSIAILPLLGVGGMQLFEAEAAGPTTDRLAPRIQDTARLLWGVYLLATVAGIVLLWIGELDFFDAVCHTFAAVATGGFSTRNDSLAFYGSYVQIVTLGLMLIGGANFSLHYYALRGRADKYWQSDEFRWYLMLIAATTLVIAITSWGTTSNSPTHLLESAFTVVSIVTTAGFVVVDYELWPVFAQGILFALTFIGGCAGSTAAGLKQVRFLLLLKHAYLQTVRLLHPRQVHVLKLDRRPVPLDIMHDVLGFTVLYLGVFVIASLMLAAAGVDLLTSGSGVISCLSTLGPGLGTVGPLENYSHLPAFAKVVLSFVMLLGRLEVSTVLVLLLRSFWRK